MAKKRRNLRSTRKPGGSAKPKRKEHCVFISHATEDKWIARWICDRIDSLSMTISSFRDDRDIAGGDRIPDSIMSAVSNCDEMIVLLTPKSIGREWITTEVAMAAVLKKRIVPLFYGIKVPDEFPLLIRDDRGFHLNEIEQFLEELQSRGQLK